MGFEAKSGATFQNQSDGSVLVSSPKEKPTAVAKVPAAVRTSPGAVAGSAEAKSNVAEGRDAEDEKEPGVQGRR